MLARLFILFVFVPVVELYILIRIGRVIGAWQSVTLVILVGLAGAWLVRREGLRTVQGIFRTWRRLTTGKMAGPGYDIEDVTCTCYFYSGYSLHTAYWHDSFGTPRSHGCVNLSPHDA